MSRRLGRLMSGAAIATVVVGSTPAISTAAWDLACDSTHRICIYKHEANPPSWPIPRATKDQTVDNYVTMGDYPNTSEAVNDTLTAARNLFASTDVRFFQDINQGTMLFCLPESTWVANVGGADNDRASSHLKGAGFC